MFARFLPRSRWVRPSGTRPAPQHLVLAPFPGVTPSPRPPVRIFIGSEAEQHRAERVLLWSIEEHRDPARTYEIFLMKDLAGFARRWWLTGFTNYRFAIPELAGRQGRAIYNDVDQIYLADPAELFDQEMGHHGFLALSEHETSVMLIDCARMAEVWTPAVVNQRRKRLETRATAWWGPLDPTWHARDETYEPGASKLLHFTTIHTQPWQPFPRDYVYQDAAFADVWLELEEAADRAAYQPFSFVRPSLSYRALVEELRTGVKVAPRNSRARQDPAPLRTLIETTESKTVLELTFTEETSDLGLDGLEVELARHDLSSGGRPPTGAFDGVLCRAGLELLSTDDVQWILEAMFRRALRFVHLELDDRGFADRATRQLGAHWWWNQLRILGLRYPDVRWSAVYRPRFGKALFREGGERIDRPPTVWVLADYKPGHTTQSVGLAEALGWPYEVKPLRFNVLNHVSNSLLGATRSTVRRASAATLASPWPDVVISTGRRTVPVARWIAEQSGGQTRLVQLGRRGANVARGLDAVISCAHFRFPIDPRRIETAAPLNRIRREELERAESSVVDPFAGRPRPHVALLVGGGTLRYRLDARTAARMGEEVSTLVAEAGGTLFAVTSRRTSKRATEALRLAIEPWGRLHRWQKEDPANPYLGLLARADVLVVSGESESMLAEAAASGKPVYIYSLPERPVGPMARFRQWVAYTAESRPLRKNGTVRPQQGLEYLCARLLQYGLVQPPRKIEDFHQTLIDLGVAFPFGAPLRTSACEPLREMDRVAEEIERLLGYSRTGAGAEEEEPVVESPRAAHA